MTLLKLTGANSLSYSVWRMWMAESAETVINALSVALRRVDDYSLLRCSKGSVVDEDRVHDGLFLNRKRRDEVRSLQLVERLNLNLNVLLTDVQIVKGDGWNAFTLRIAT